MKKHRIVCGGGDLKCKDSDGLECVSRIQAYKLFLKAGHVFYTTGQIPIKPSKNQMLYIYGMEIQILNHLDRKLILITVMNFILHIWRIAMHYSISDIYTHADFLETNYTLPGLMQQPDVLIGDYSSASMQYLVIDKPQAFVVPDIDEYSKKRGGVCESGRLYGRPHYKKQTTIL